MHPALTSTTSDVVINTGVVGMLWAIHRLGTYFDFGAETWPKRPPGGEGGCGVVFV